MIRPGHIRSLRFAPARGIHALVAVAALWPLVLHKVAAQQPPDPSPQTEFQVKAALVFKFAKFIDWPEEAFAERDSSLVVTVIGDDPVGACIAKDLANATVKGRKIEVKMAKGVDNLESSHILFVSRSVEGSWPEIRKAIQGKPVLTVSDIEGFTRRCGVIGFFLEDRKVRFEINPEVGKTQQLGISAKLLRLAVIAKGDCE